MDGVAADIEALRAQEAALMAQVNEGEAQMAAQQAQFQQQVRGPPAPGSGWALPRAEWWARQERGRGDRPRPPYAPTARRTRTLP